MTYGIAQWTPQPQARANERGMSIKKGTEFAPARWARFWARELRYGYLVKRVQKHCSHSRKLLIDIIALRIFLQRVIAPASCMLTHVRSQKTVR